MTNAYQTPMIEIGPNAEIPELEGPLAFAGISFDDDYTVMLRALATGRCAEIPVGELVRDPALIARLPVADALRIGIFGGEWLTRCRVGELPRAA